MKLAIVGVTGLVGQRVMEVLDEMKFEITEFIPVASESSQGNHISFGGQEFKIVTNETAILKAPDIAIFSAGSEVSLKWAPKYAEKGTFVIDNSSAWRMNDQCPLIVPEINAEEITEESKIIANPNCSTIQMVMVLAPLHEKYGIKRLVISTYQSYTGTGIKAVRQYEDEKNGLTPKVMAYPHPIFENCLPHCDIFLENDYTKEEMKLVFETRKILSTPELAITATAVRVPVSGGHSESVNVEFFEDFDIKTVNNILSSTEGVVLQDDVSNNVYPTPLQSKNKNEVFVGRVRRDESTNNGLNLWIVSDNLRKGAATNAVQIAQYVKKEFLSHV